MNTLIFYIVVSLSVSTVTGTEMVYVKDPMVFQEKWKCEEAIATLPKTINNDRVTYICHPIHVEVLQ